MSNKLIRCENKDCVWWQDYTCSKKLITINQNGICSEVAKKQIVKNNQEK